MQPVSSELLVLTGIMQHSLRTSYFGIRAVLPTIHRSKNFGSCFLADINPQQSYSESESLLARRHLTTFSSK